MSEFLKALSASELPVGSSRAVNLKGETIALFNINGEIFAIENACCHQGGPLAEGTLKGSVVKCPWHSWPFDVTTGKSPVVPDAAVRSFRTKVENDHIFVEV